MGVWQCVEWWRGKASEQRLPKCKGSWHGEAVTEGLCSKMLRICIYLGEEGLLYHRIDILINAGKIPTEFTIF